MEEFLNEFLTFVDKRTYWKINNDVTNSQVINEFINSRVETITKFIASVGEPSETRENSLHKHIVNGSKLDRINRMKELFEKGLVRFDGEAAKETERLIIGVDFGSGKDESRNHIYCR